MRILHVIPHYYPALRYGGPIRSVQGLAAATAALGHDVHVYTTNIDGRGYTNAPTCVPIEIRSVNVWYFPVAFGRRVYRSPEMGKALDATVSAFDIIHIHYAWVWTTNAAASAARRHGVPYVLSPRGMLVADLIRRRSPIAKKIWLELFDKRNVAGAAAMHVTSDIEANDVSDLGLAIRRVVVIPNGVEFPNGCAPEFKCSDLKSPVATEKYILFLGRVSWKKGLDQLVRSLVDVDAELIVAGYDEEDYRLSLEKLACDHGVHSRVRFIGPVEGDAKWALIKRARCLVLPSYNENFGMAVIEAMAVGCPVVVTEQVGLANVVAKGECGLVAPSGARGLSNAINSILDDPERARRMGLNGIAVAREQFSWPAIAERMVDLYDECAQRSFI